jgi:hypothetical protein
MCLMINFHKKCVIMVNEVERYDKNDKYLLVNDQLVGGKTMRKTEIRSGLR